MFPNRSLLFLFCLAFVLLSCAGPGKKFACSEVRIEQGVPALFVDGERYPPFAYMSYLGEEQYYREIASAGIHLYNFPVYFGDRGINSSSGIKPFRPAIWVGENEYDYSSIEDDFRKILRADPQARVILRVHLDPPQWWERENPDAVCMLPGGGSLRTSFFSAKWREDAGQVLADCIEWLGNSPYARHLAGIHIAAGYTEEWFYHFRDFFYDENPERITKFRQWLKHKYGDDPARLKEAWNDGDAKFDTALPADISGRDAAMRWRDPAAERRLFDTFDFHAETLVDHIAYFCGVVKRASGGCLLAGAFNGYHYFVTDPRRGHGALAKLLECGDLDFLSSPNDYNRVVGEDWPPMSAIGSVQKHGKLWLAENDTRTAATTLLRDRAPHVAPDNDAYDTGVWIGPESMDISVSLLWKNLARMLAGGYGGWWFDMWGGWFSDPRLLEVLGKGQELFRKYPDEEFPVMKAQVCVIVDERLQLWDASYGHLSGRIISNRYALAKTGAPYDLFLRSDLETIDADRYKAVWLMGIPDITQRERDLTDELTDHGITVMLTDTVNTYIKSGNLPGKEYPGKRLWSAEELGALWRDAGVHRYLSTADVFYAGRGWIGIHTADGGDKMVRLPFTARQVVNAVSGEVVCRDSDTFELQTVPGSTVLLRVLR